MSRRGENIFKRKDGRWEARFITGRNADGTAKYAYVYAKTYREVKEKRLIKQSSLNSIQQQNFTYQCWLYKWLELIRPTVKESTFACYNAHIKKHIIPNLGNTNLHELSRIQIQEFINKKLSCGRLDGKGALSSKTISEILNVIRLSIQSAQQNNLINAIDLKFKIPKTFNKIEVLSSNETEKLINFIYKNMNSAGIAVILSLYCGLRIGEICALSWEDVDLEQKELHITKTLYRIPIVDSKDSKTKIVISTTKTNCSTRTIPLPDSVVNTLKLVKEHNPVYLVSNKYTPSEPRVLTYAYKRILKKAGLRDITFHSLRHTFATKCIEIGFDYNILSEILGHSKPSITMNLYVHPKEENKRAYMNRLQINHCQNFSLK